MSNKETNANLLIIDDDETVRNFLFSAARSRGWQPVTASSGGEGCQLIGAGIKAVVLDHGLPDGDGIAVLVRLREKHPTVPVVMLTGLNDAETAVRALKAGADDYLTKPFELERLFCVLQDACRVRSQNSAAHGVDCRATADSREALPLTSRCPDLREFFTQLKKAARLDITLLLTGESGTGKTLIAREIHRLSARADQPFIPVSCPALPRELLESELFGHERGAFTGATACRMGRFEQATKGTIFLDEIGDLPGELQPKLLTVLQNQEFFRVGGNRILRTGARIIAATNTDLMARVAEGRFREDLYYRLNVLELRLPPLRARKEDIPDLIERILARIAGKRGNVPWRISPAAVRILGDYPWPGNVRQLENVLERATVFADGPLLDEHDFSPLAQDLPGASPEVGEQPHTLQETERQAFLDAYSRSGKNKARTARNLGIAERTVYNLLARHGIK